MCHPIVKESQMIRENLSGLLFAGVLAVNPASNALAHPLGSPPAIEAKVITVQGWPRAPWGAEWGGDQGRREHCWRLRNRAQEIRQQINSTTLLLGSESGWNGIFGEFGRDLEASAGTAEDGNRLPYLISLTLDSSNARRQLRPDQFGWRQPAPALTLSSFPVPCGG